MMRTDRCCYWGSPYLDAYGEHDALGERGKPLHLDQSFYDQLRTLLVEHKLDDEILSPSQTTPFFRTPRFSQQW